MHKYYDPDLFKMCDVLTEEVDIRARFAPRVSNGVVLAPSNVDVGVDVAANAVDVTTAEHFVAAGFDITFVGPDGETASSILAGAGADAVGGAPESGIPVEGEDELIVTENVFRRWLELSAMRRGLEFARWWVNKDLDEEGVIDAMKLVADDSATDLFDRICTAVASGKTQADPKVPEGAVALVDLVAWIQEHGVLQDCEDDEALMDELLLEFQIVSDRGGGFDDQGCMEEPLNQHNEDDEALRTAERLVYGWPSKQAEPTGAVSDGRFVKTFPLDFLMGVGDLYDILRIHKVSAAEWVQHLLRYHTGHFVGGMRGQRVVWAMGNGEYFASH